MQAQEAVQANHDSWVNRNRWKLGLTLAALIGGWWWHRSHRPAINVGPVSERWLAEQAFEAGQRPTE